MSGSPVIGRCPVRSTLHSKRPTTAAQLKRCLGESWNAPQPLPVQVSELANAPGSGEFQLEAFQFTTDTGPQGEQPGWLLTENETDFGLLFNAKSDGPFVKVAFHDYVINKATDELSIMRGELGSFQRNRIERTLDLLSKKNENLAAAQSTIQDTDVAVEISNLAREQLRLNASQSMLAQANQEPGKVLSLLR